MRPLDIYDLGVWLAQRATTEAGKRAAVSRLYYGLYHEACCRYFRENPDAPPLPRNRRHAALRTLFSRTPVGAQQDVASRLEALGSMRGECDYRLGELLRHAGRPITVDQMLSRAMAIATALFSDLDAYSPGESTGDEARVTGV